MNKAEIMRRAWQIQKEDSRYIFGLCLKMAWAEAKEGRMEQTKKTIEELEELGFKRWTKGNMDRMYIDARNLGLEVDYYKTGNVCAATFDGYRISNCEARRLLAAKTYIDLKTGKVHSNHRWLAEPDAELAGFGYEVA